MSAEDGHQFHFSVTSQGSYRAGDGPHEDSEDIGEPFRLTVRAWSLSEACEKASAVPLAEWTQPAEDDTREHEYLVVVTTGGVRTSVQDARSWEDAEALANGIERDNPTATATIYRP